MKISDRNNKKTVRSARHIYRLVCSDNDIQADTELRGCGDNAIEIANELISGEFQSTLARRLTTQCGWCLSLTSPSAVYMACIVFRIGTPHGLLNTLIRVFMFVVLCLLGYATEAAVVCKVREWDYKRWTAAWYDPGRRTTRSRLPGVTRRTRLTHGLWATQ